MYESEGIESTSVQIREPFENRAVFSVLVHLYGTSAGACARLHVIAKDLGNQCLPYIPRSQQASKGPDGYMNIGRCFKPKQ